LSPEDLREVRTLFGYPEMSAGRLMPPDHVAVRPEWTVGQALARIRQKGGIARLST
jgi:magnesium transporter